jgi:peptidyl-tRNA hydrolase, PTH1 family
MALFQKNPYSSDTGKQLYSFGHTTTLLIVGLGNVGAKYAQTRHNLGFLCVDYFAKQNEFPDWMEKKDARAYIAKKTLGETEVILLKPATMMNLSGEAVQAIAHFYKIPTNKTIVVHDELDIPYGQIRTRTGGGPAGHNGIKSLIKHIGKDFGRIRIGIDSKERPEQMDSSDYVLAKLTKSEQATAPTLIKEVGSIITETIYSGQLATETRKFIL